MATQRYSGSNQYSWRPAQQQTTLLADRPATKPARWWKRHRLAALEELSQDRRSGIRLLVAANLACPKSAFEILSHDLYVGVRRAVANNPACPLDILQQTAQDRDPRTASSAAANRSRQLWWADTE
jgi:hypothetical protein